MSERWIHALLVFLLLGHLFLLSTDSRARDNRLEGWILSLTMPVAHTADTVSDGVGGIFSTARSARSLRAENLALRGEVEDLRAELVKLQGVEEQLDRLARTRGYTRLETSDAFVADVVFLDPKSWLRTLVIYTGTAEPGRNQPVFTDRGLVGRVVRPAGRYAKVLLLTDRSFSVSAMVARTRQRGMVSGASENRLTLDYIPSQADVEVGDEVVTAGIDGIFPRALRIGRVASIKAGQGLFHRIEVTPAVDFDRLDQVFVLHREALPSEIAEALSTDEDLEARNGGS